MGKILLILVACIAPSLFFLTYIYFKKERGHREPLRCVALAFSCGMIAAPIAYFIFEGMTHLPYYSKLSRIWLVNDQKELFAYIMFAVAPLEELLKFTAVWISVFRMREFDQPADGIVYSSTAALGFATVENWYFMWFVEEVVWTRAVTLPFNHILFSSFIGYGLGVSIVSKRWRFWIVLIGLALSIIYHGLYDYILLNEQLSDFFIIPFVLLLWFWMTTVFGKLQNMKHLKRVHW